MWIDRLSLRLTGVTPEEGERLGRLVADRLGAAAIRPRRPRLRPVERLDVHVSGTPRQGLDRLADQIVAELLGELERSGS